MNDTFKVILALSLTTAMSGFIVAFSHASMAPLLSLQTKRQQLATVEQVVAKGSIIVDAAGSPPLPSRYWIAKKGPVTCGYAFLMETSGCFGPVSAVVGVDTGGVIVGMVVLSENESPARGGHIHESILKRTLWNGFFMSNENVQPFAEQFIGINVKKPISIATTTAEWSDLPETAKKELIDKNTISGVSGATVSSRAVVRGIEKTIAPYLASVRGAKQ